MITYEVLPVSSLQKINPLWEKLNQIHLHDSPHFRALYSSYHFDDRWQFIGTLKSKDVRIYVAKNDEIPVGYCVSTITGNVGEIQSLMVEEDHLKLGIGTRLVQDAKNWFVERQVEKAKVAVSFGHESVFAFYEKLGFFPRLTYLERKDVGE